jgi:hypothetical protein
MRSLKGNATPRRALTSSASLARGKKQLREANVSIDQVDAAMGLAHRICESRSKGSDSRIGGKGRYGDLEIRAFEARHCVRRLSPATLGVHLRDLFAMNRNKQRREY